jgi:cell division protease FtsH
VSDNNPLDKLPTPGGDSRGPQNQRSFLVTLLIIVAIVAYLAFSTGQSPLSSSDTVDTLATNEFVTAVKDDRVNSVTFKTSDGSISGDYWTSEDDLGDKSKLQKFKSYYVGADSLEELMAKHSETSFTIDTSDGSAWETVLLSVVPTLLLVGVFVYYMRRMSEQNGRTMDFAKTKAQTTEEERPKVKFSDVAGIDEAVEELKEVRDFLREPERYQKMGAKIPHGVLLVGPRARARRCLPRPWPARRACRSSRYPALTSWRCSWAWAQAACATSSSRPRPPAPCIIFIDEIDAVGRQRGAGLGGGHDEREQTLNQLLVEMDGFEDNSAVILIAATNRPDILDPALLRPGRFDRRVTVDRPPTSRGARRSCACTPQQAL